MKLQDHSPVRVASIQDFPPLDFVVNVSKVRVTGGVCPYLGLRQFWVNYVVFSINPYMT